MFSKKWLCRSCKDLQSHFFVFLLSIKIAVTSIKIDGVLHEISTIPGVVEDVTEIVLNVKGIVAKLYCDSPKTVVIDVTGEKDITAGDIKQDSDIEVLNPEHHIATVGENERFYMELTFDNGRGYVSQEKNKAEHSSMLGNGTTAPIGTIYTDSIYTPVYKVCYTVDENRLCSRNAESGERKGRYKWIRSEMKRNCRRKARRSVPSAAVN